MPFYRIALKPAVERDLGRIPNADQKRIARKISALSEDPRPPGAMKLKQAKELWRIRVGEYRILYQVQDGVSLILNCENSPPPAGLPTVLAPKMRLAAPTQL